MLTRLSGPTPGLWTGEMKADLISRLCGKPPSNELENIYPDLKSRYNRDLNFEEAYRMVQRLKLEGRLDFDARSESWYIPEGPQKVPLELRSLRPVLFGR